MSGFKFLVKMEKSRMKKKNKIYLTKSPKMLNSNSSLYLLTPLLIFINKNLEKKLNKTLNSIWMRFMKS